MLTKAALSRHRGTVNGFEDRALPALLTKDLDADQLHDLLGRLRRPDVDNLPTLIVRDLLSGTKRYSALQRSLAGISPRMLAARLAMLEEAGLITKTIYPTVPPKTEYSLTEKGRQVEPVIAAMAAFGATL